MEELCQIVTAWSPHIDRRNARSNTTFMTLPLEIREVIYHFAMEGLPTQLSISEDKCMRGWTLYPNTLPNICFVSKQIWQEACLVFIRRTQFQFPYWYYGKNLSLWLSQLPDHKGYKAVRTLYFDRNEYCQFLPPLKRSSAGDINLGPPYTGIRSLVFEASAEALVYRSRVPLREHHFTLHSCQQRVEFMKSLYVTDTREIIQSLDSLKHVKIVCKDWDNRKFRLFTTGSVHDYKDLFTGIFDLLVQCLACRDGVKLEVEFQENEHVWSLPRDAVRTFYHPQ